MKLFFIVAALLLSITTQAQDTIRIPAPIAKQIVLDLISGDSAKAELGLVQQQLSLTNKVVVLKDSIISSCNQKNALSDIRIKNEQMKYDTQGIFVKQLQTNVKKLKTKVTFVTSTFLALTGGLIYLYIVK